jgi:hypothetical protein
MRFRTPEVPFVLRQDVGKLCRGFVRLGRSRTIQFGRKAGKAQENGNRKRHDPTADQVPIRMDQPGNELISVVHESLC